MSENDLPESENENPKAEFRQYVIGLILAVILTVASFVVATNPALDRLWLLVTLGGLALIQIAVHFRCFLHIDLKQSHRDDLQLILFAGLIILLMVGGTMWILLSQMARM